MFPWRLLLWKWIKYIFTVIIVKVAKRKICFIGKFHDKSSRICRFYITDFLEIFTSGRHHRDLKILKILTSNSKRFRVYGIFQNDKLMMIDGGDQLLHFVRYRLLKITSSLKNFSGYVFWLAKLKNDIKVALKPTAIRL